MTLTDYDPLGEEKVIAAAMYASSDLPDDRLQSLAHTMSPDERDAVLSAYVGERGNRRHKPGRAFERTGYRFDVLCDYGAFRDLQRHRLLTLEWQRLSPEHGFDTPEVIADAGMTEEWNRVMEDSAATWATLFEHAGEDVAQYAVAMAYRIRFVMQMSAREAMHLIELRSSPQGHPTYRRVAQQMHDLSRRTPATAPSPDDDAPRHERRGSRAPRGRAPRRGQAKGRPGGLTSDRVAACSRFGRCMTTTATSTSASPRGTTTLPAEMFQAEVIDPVVDVLAGIAGVGRALELGIGTGRIALPLAKRGVSVHGIDLSKTMVARLRAKPGGEDIGVTIGDFATTSVDGSYSLAYLVFNTIMNLTTQEAQVACFRNAAAHLEPRGCFVIEVTIPELRRLPPTRPSTSSTRSRTIAIENHWGIDEYDVATQG